MSSHEENVLYSLLSDVDSVDILAREGLLLEAIPTEGMRPVVAWVLEAYYEGGRTKAPSREMIRATWGDVLEANEIDLGDGTEVDDIELAIDGLKARYVHLQVQQFQKEFATKMSEADNPEKLSVLTSYTDQLSQLSQSLVSRNTETDFSTGMGEVLAGYQARVAAGTSVQGLPLYLPQVDEHMGGIHPGELCIIAAPAKTGKSYLAAFVAIKAAMAGKTVVLYTLENTVEMTWDRIACLQLGISPTRWQRGEATEEEVQRVQDFIEATKTDTPSLHVIKPDLDQSTPEFMVRHAQNLGCDALIIDQLSHVKPYDTRKGRPEQIQELMKSLKRLVSESRYRMPCILFHQIKREGIVNARKNGFLVMDDLAEGSETERSSDWVLSLYQSTEAFTVNQTLLQTLASRRRAPAHWVLNWGVEMGMINVSHETNPYG